MYVKIVTDEFGIYLNCLHSIKVEQTAKVFISKLKFSLMSRQQHLKYKKVTSYIRSWITNLVCTMRF